MLSSVGSNEDVSCDRRGVRIAFKVRDGSVVSSTVLRSPECQSYHSRSRLYHSFISEENHSNTQRSNAHSNVTKNLTRASRSNTGTYFPRKREITVKALKDLLQRHSWREHGVEDHWIVKNLDLCSTSVRHIQDVLGRMSARRQ